MLVQRCPFLQKVEAVAESAQLKQMPVWWIFKAIGINSTLDCVSDSDYSSSDFSSDSE